MMLLSITVDYRYGNREDKPIRESVTRNKLAYAINEENVMTGSA